MRLSIHLVAAVVAMGEVYMLTIMRRSSRDGDRVTLLDALRLRFTRRARPPLKVDDWVPPLGFMFGAVGAGWVCVLVAVVEIQSSGSTVLAVAQLVLGLVVLVAFIAYFRRPVEE